MKILIKVSYDGTNYSGWQVQPSADTVQERLENAIKDLTGEEVRVTGSGRTDSGVHAKGQIAHFETQSKIPAEKFKDALNVRLPDDIRVLESREGSDNFHSVKSAKKKTYTYVLTHTENALCQRYAHYLTPEPDFEKMKSATKLFVGTHDFKGFSASGGSAKTSVRKIYSFSVKKSGDLTKFTITGNGFLYKMVRMLVGAVVSLGQGKISCEEIVDALKFGKKPKYVLTLPAKGLTLDNVVYPELKDK